MSPTVYFDGKFRFAFYSREEPRMHVHVHAPDGEAKIWLEPSIEMAHSHGLSERDVARALASVQAHQQEIRDAWRQHQPQSN